MTYPSFVIAYPLEKFYITFREIEWHKVWKVWQKKAKEKLNENCLGEIFKIYRDSEKGKS